VSRHRLILLIAFVAFIALGMPKAAFGVAWPSMAIDLSAPLADLGLFVAIHTGAYFVASLVSGRLSHRIGNGPMLTASAWALTLGLAGYAAAPNRAGLALAAVVLGLGGGLLDAGINAHVALDYGARAMGLLHASFGIGATMGPLVMTVILALDASWRIGFVPLVALQAGIAIAIWRTSADWDTAAEKSGGRPRLPSAQRTTAALAVLVFALIGSIEVSTGSWTYTLLTEGLHHLLLGLDAAGGDGGEDRPAAAVCGVHCVSLPMSCARTLEYDSPTALIRFSACAAISSSSPRGGAPAPPRFLRDARISSAPSGGTSAPAVISSATCR